MPIARDDGLCSHVLMYIVYCSSYKYIGSYWCYGPCSLPVLTRTSHVHVRYQRLRPVLTFKVRDCAHTHPYRTMYKGRTYVHNPYWCHFTCCTQFYGPYWWDCFNRNRPRWKWTYNWWCFIRWVYRPRQWRFQSIYKLFFKQLLV